MKRGLTFAVVALATAASPAAGMRAASLDQLRGFEVAVVVHLPNERTASTWRPHSALVRSAFVDDLYTVDSLCVFSDNPQRDAARVAYGWHVESQVVRASESEVVVNVTWKRTHDAGASTSQGGSVELTVTPGSRIELDRVVARPPTTNAERACLASAMSLEVRMPRPAGLSPSAPLSR